MRPIFALIALSLAACSPTLTQTQMGGVVHNVSAFRQREAFEMAKQNCDMSGLAIRIVTLILFTVI